MASGRSPEESDIDLTERNMEETVCYIITE